MFNLKEALEVIESKPEFSCNERDFGFVIDYNVTMPGTFIGSNERQTTILQNLRGTCFDKSGKIIRLAYHKFHNLNENEEYHESKFNFGQPHWIEEKLDGSMVAPIPYNDGTYRFGTRAGVTDVAVKAERFFSTLDDITKSEYNELIFYCISMGYTPIFEYCSRDQRIVIDYPVSKLVLTGVRDIDTGEYRDIYDFTHGLERIEKVKTYPMVEMSVKELSNVIKNSKDEFEGVVVKFDDGRFVMIKTEDYVLKHRALDGLRFEKDVLKMILTNTVDDVLPLVSEDIKNRLLAYQESVISHIKMANKDLDDIWNNRDITWSRKEFAMFAQHFPYKKFLFARMDNKDISIKDYVIGNCSSQTTVDSVRWLIGPSYNSF